MVNALEPNPVWQSGRPAVSVLMPVYNEDTSFLDVACRSILEQSFADFEVVIVDDGSQRPETIAWLDRAHGMDPRIRVYHEPHRGLTCTLNVGLSYCRGQFICRQDSDDWSAPDRFARQIAFLRRHSELAVAGSWVMLHQQDRTPLWIHRLPCDPKTIAAAFHKMNPFCHGAVCFRGEAVAAIGGYREEFSSSQDYDLLWRLCDRFGGANVPEVLYHYRFTATSISANRARDQARNRSLARRLAVQRAAGLPESFDLTRREIDAELPGDDVTALLKQGDHLLLAGHYLAALKIHLRAVLRAPSRRLPYLKMCRLALFLVAPAKRPILFGHAQR